MCKSDHAGRDIVHRVNKTHIELNTRHVVAKTGGFRLFDVHEEGSGGGPPGPLANGMTGIGIVGEGMILLTMVLVAWWIFKKCAKYRVKHEAYRGFYRAQLAQSPMALTQVPTREYGPDRRATAELLREIRAARQELRAAKGNTASTPAKVHAANPEPEVVKKHVYDDSDDDLCIQTNYNAI